MKKREIDKYIIRKEVYNENYMKRYVIEDDINMLMVKASMGLGKTKNLKEVFDEYSYSDKTIAIVSFRITLDKEYIKNFDGFTFYQDIEETTYDIDHYRKLVVQIDSFHKIRGKIDLLILDEFTYTATHLVERAKYKDACFNALTEYINDYNNKIILLDALIDDYTVKWFSKQNRKIKFIINNFKKHKNKKIINYKNKIGIFIDSIINNLKNNKKIILPTNSKGFLNNLEFKIRTQLPNIKCKFLDSDNSNDINLDNWNQYDIVGYTPTIVAGVSFEQFHFDKCFGYFVNSSSPAEMSLQQLFRVRNIEDNEIHLCIENKDNIKYPNDMEEIEKYIIDRNSCLIEGVLGVNISRINKTIIKDSYYYLYRDVQVKIFRSKNDYEYYLLKLLKFQGIDDIIEINEVDLEKDKQIRKEIRENSSKNKEKNINDIVLADEINDDQYEILKNKYNLNYNEKNILKKKTFRKNFNYDKEITPKVYTKYNNKYNQFKNINVFYNINEDFKDYITDKIQIIEDNKIDRNEKVGKENDFGKLIHTANTMILHQSKKSEKILIGLELLNILGINTIFYNESFKIDFKKLYEYIIKREYIIRILFKCKKIDIKSYKDEKEILKYINSRLRTLYNITIKKQKDNSYKIANLDFWDEDINPMKENEDLKMEMYIKTILSNTDFDITSF